METNDEIRRSPLPGFCYKLAFQKKPNKAQQAEIRAKASVPFQFLSTLALPGALITSSLKPGEGYVLTSAFGTIDRYQRFSCLRN
ncbi:hypothetical protein HNY73_003282 [Argiope bruennichi]|uniref:Uncharacterized protein n=1 Tax=Argiope bruennichi TaxID=94029 RepID=A0A8T0FWC7_ARGBR|nr:hypothetical protein HNY73_003282 [Argiope bruennichi]